MLNIPEIEISVKVKKIPKEERFSIKSSKDAAAAFRQLFDADKIEWREEAILLCLNRSNEVTGFFKISSGGMAGTVIDPKVVFTIALNCCAHGLILAHNHPSGNLNTSQADKQLTQKIKESGKLLDISLLDHLIITEENYFSMADNGEM